MKRYHFSNSFFTLYCENVVNQHKFLLLWTDAAASYSSLWRKLAICICYQRCTLGMYSSFQTGRWTISQWICFWQVALMGLKSDLNNLLVSVWLVALTTGPLRQTLWHNWNRHLRDMSWPDLSIFWETKCKWCKLEILNKLFFCLSPCPRYEQDIVLFVWASGI